MLLKKGRKEQPFFTFAFFLLSKRAKLGLLSKKVELRCAFKESTAWRMSHAFKESLALALAKRSESFQRKQARAVLAYSLLYYCFERVGKKSICPFQVCIFLILGIRSAFSGSFDTAGHLLCMLNRK